MKKQELVRNAMRWALGVMACVAMATGAQAATIDITQANIAQNRTLQNGNTYRFVEDVEYAAATTAESALKVADGATVALIIPEDVIVTLRGGQCGRADRRRRGHRGAVEREALHLWHGYAQRERRQRGERRQRPRRRRPLCRKYRI